MIQEAIVTKVREDGLAEVVVERMGICGGDCNGCSECKYENLMKSVVQNPIAAPRGAHVYIETPTSGVVKGAFAIYVLPIALLIIGYLAASLIGFGEGVCIAAAFAGAVIGVLIAIVVSKKRHMADPTPTKITSIIYRD